MGDSRDTPASGGNWEHLKLAQVRMKVFRGHFDAINSCQFCNQDTLILSASNDKTIRFWESDGGSQVQSLSLHSDIISCCRVNSKTDPKFSFVTSSWDKSIAKWDGETGHNVWRGFHDGIVTTCAISSDGNIVVSASDGDYVIKIWDTRTAENAVHTIKNLHKGSVTNIAFHPDNSRICTTSSDMTAKIWDLNTTSTTAQLSGHKNIVSCCAFSNNGRLLCTGSWDKSLHIWDIATGSYRRTGPSVIDRGHEGSISSCSFSADDSMLVSASYDQNVIIWDTKYNVQKFSLKGHNGWVNDVCFSQDQKWALTCSSDMTIRMWNIESEEKMPIFLANKISLGLKLISCSQCGKKFSITEAGDDFSLTRCVFCRLKDRSKVLNITAID